MTTVFVATNTSVASRRKKGLWATRQSCSICRSILFVVNIFFVAALIIVTSVNVTVRRQDGMELHHNPVHDLKPHTSPRNFEQDVTSSLTAQDKHQHQHQQQSMERQQDDASCKLRVRSIRDLQACYPRELVRALPERECGRVTEWPDVQRCLNHGQRFDDSAQNTGASPPSPPPPVLPHYDISLIGERNSGTKFVTQELQLCFRSLMTARSGSRDAPANTSTARTLARRGAQPLSFPTVKIHRDFHRHKHFFQPLYAGGPDLYRHRIVIALFRNPVEWVAAMRENPYHSPHHVAGYETVTTQTAREGAEGRTGADEIRVVPLPWREFVGRPWTTDRTAKDLEILGSPTRIRETMRGETCLWRYSVLDAVPCVFDANATQYPAIPDSLLRGYVPLYELRRDQSQRPFANLLELRAEKIVNFLIEVPLVYKDLGGYVAVRYEDLVRDGTRPFLELVAGLLGLKNLPPDCTPMGPQPERLGRRNIPEDFRRWVVQHMDPDLEHLLGYND